MKTTMGNTWITIYKISTLLGMGSVMPHGTSFRILLLTWTKWASSIGHPSKERVGMLPRPLNHWPMTLICILMTPSWNCVYGPICILVALVDTP